MEMLKELLVPLNSAGRVVWLGYAPVKGEDVLSVDTIEVTAGAGIVGDHHFRRKSRSKRQVTLIQHEHLAVVTALLGSRSSSVIPEELRRNIVVSGVSVAQLRFQTFRIGTAVFRGTGACPPCSRMEKNLGIGGYSAMLGHGGITAVIEESGQVRIGDSITAPIDD